VIRAIPWHESELGGPLGRNLEHDPRSRSFPALRQLGGARNHVLHTRHAKILDQGALGSCTGNALEGALGTNPLHIRFERHTEKKAVRLYSLATQIDEFSGEWPPSDTGSSGLAVCKAGVQLGRLTRYDHAFGIDHALDALQYGPVITGTDWYEGFDRPDIHGVVRITGGIRGGHEFVVRGYDPFTDRVFCDQSWGDWGPLRGHFLMEVKTWATLLEAEGDVTVPVR
jgi:hypothetical protein